MKIQTQSRPNLEQLGRLVKDIRTVMWTDKAGQDEFRSHPMTPLEMDAEGCIWFFADEDSARAHEAHPVNLAFSDEGRSVYVSVSGQAEAIRDTEKIKALWTPMAKPWFPDGPESPSLTLLKFIPHTAEYWDSPHSKVIRSLAVASSILAGKPIDMGEHQVLQGLQAKNPSDDIYPPAI